MELDKLLQRCIVSPGSLGSQRDSSLLSAIIDLVTTEEHANHASQQNYRAASSARHINTTNTWKRPTYH